jgi:hypothetical protein
MSHKFTDAAPRNPFDITITKSPLYREPETDMGDLLGERRATQQQIDVLNRAADTPEVRQENERIKADRDRLMSGYFRNGEHLGQFAPEPRIPEEQKK